MSSRLFGSGGLRGGTGEETISELVVFPCIRKRSSRPSSCCTSGASTFIIRQSSPVTRWHSTTSRRTLRQLDDLREAARHRTHANVGGDCQAERLRIHFQPFAPDHAGFLQAQHALVHGRRRHVDAPRQLANREARLRGQVAQDRQVGRVQGRACSLRGQSAPFSFVWQESESPGLAFAIQEPANCEHHARPASAATAAHALRRPPRGLFAVTDAVTYLNSREPRAAPACRERGGPRCRRKDGSAVEDSLGRLVRGRSRAAGRVRVADRRAGRLCRTRAVGELRHRGRCAQRARRGWRQHRRGRSGVSVQLLQLAASCSRARRGDSHGDCSEAVRV